MSKCTRCGRGGLFRKINAQGFCSDCDALVKIENQRNGLIEEIKQLGATLSDKQQAYSALKAEAEAAALKQAADALQDIENRRIVAEADFLEMQASTISLQQESDKREKSAEAAIRKVSRSKEIIKAIRYAQDLWDDPSPEAKKINVHPLDQEIDEFLQPTVELDLQCMSLKDLRKRYRENEKCIDETLHRYEGRYTTKANMAIYRLMVIALRSELQNILFNIRFGKLDDALNNVKTVTGKYYTIAAEGNQSIAPTLKKFIGEIEYLFIQAVNIEYTYYVQQERAKEEQRAIREQMRQEAEERRELERQQKQIEKEESKFHDQINQLNEQLSQNEDPEKERLLQERIAELQQQLAAVAEEKDRIVTLQNGKAGNVYIISNIGSFGDDVFKIGMTRRLDPQQRIDELGSASVPFPFDVHSMIFSDNAPELETRLHHMLNDQRVNKVNLRKEFFRVSLDELENIISEIEPTAEFRRTILAEQYRQSLSITNIPESMVTEEDSSNEFEDDAISDPDFLDD